MKGLLRIAKHLNWCRDLYHSSAISILLTAYFVCTEYESLELLTTIIDKSLPVMLTFIGCTFAAYALLFAFGFFNRLKEHKSLNMDISIYSKTNGAFQINLLTQAMGIGGILLLSIITSQPVEAQYANCINYAGCFIVISYLSYQFLMLRDMIVICHNIATAEEQL